jgi:hypothetical protein
MKLNTTCSEKNSQRKNTKMKVAALLVSIMALPLFPVRDTGLEAMPPAYNGIHGDGPDDTYCYCIEVPIQACACELTLQFRD